MFTGLVEEVGEIISLRREESGVTLRLRAVQVLEDVELGASISLDGACHTVTHFGPEFFEVHSVATTLGRTIVGSYREGQRVNLERAAKLGDRIGGHLVQGHVDGVGEVLSTQQEGSHLLIDFSMPEAVASVTILQGSVTLNGVSLTVNALPGPGRAQVSIIPHTRDVTTLGELAEGDPINLEGDMIGKYVRQLLTGPAGDPDAHVRERWGYER